MDDHLAAIGRTFGKVDTDSGGMARYSLRLDVPPGITHDTAPEISLEYCQGAPNGSLGAGWALGGLSCIRRTLSTMAYDGPNAPGLDYDRLKPKLSLDGAELLNVVGTYDSAEAVYSTEMENAACTITRLGTGFLLCESTGHQAEYGTTADSCVMIAGTTTAREWRLNKRMDYYGNTITYTYVASGLATAADINTRCISEICYTSNEKSSLQASRYVSFKYSGREDLVVQTSQGEKRTLASLLTSIQFGILSGSGEVSRFSRSYELAYGRCPHTGDSQLSSVTEISEIDGKMVKLLPSLFGYTSTGVEANSLFTGSSSRMTSLNTGGGNLALFTTNISGRCLADIACVRYDNATGHMFLKTFLADRHPDGEVTWGASADLESEASLPLIDRTSGFPDILCPDMNNDGRADIVVPFQDRNHMVNFSISQCVGTGYQKAIVKSTGNLWTPGSKFMAVEHDRKGSVDIVEIFAASDRHYLTFRNYPCINENGSIGLGDPVTTRTNYDARETLDWFQLKHSSTGAKSITRIWASGTGRGMRQLKATTFALREATGSSGGFEELSTSLLGDPVSSNAPVATVLPCDINADGTQDIVLVSAESDNNKMIMKSKVYLGNGDGGFSEHGDQKSQVVDAPTPLKPGKFHMTNFDGSTYPTIGYVYQTRNTRAYVCLSAEGRSDASLGNFQVNKLVDNLPFGQMELIPVDVNGKGTGDWILYTLENDTPRVISIHNRATVPGHLAWAQSPMGLRTSLTYGSMTDPTVYTSGVDWKKYDNAGADDYVVIAAPNLVVTGLEHENEASINSLSYKLSLKKTYTKARINSTGRGWQGFAEITTHNVTDAILTKEKYLQAWPFTGIKVQIDTIDAEIDVLLRSVRTQYESHFTAKGSWKICRLNRMLEQTDMLEANVVARSNGVHFQYDDNGNLILRSTFESQLDKIMFQSYNRCQYTTIDGVTSVLVSTKLSSKEANLDMAKFEDGDCSLTIYENDSSRATLKGISEWSTDVGAFIKKTVRFNQCGKEIEAISAAGLKRTTTYDSMFQSFPVKITEEGVGVSSTQFTAFDEMSGLEVATREVSGAIHCFALDSFGRTYETRTGAATQGMETIGAKDFLKKRNFIADPAFLAVLEKTHLNPQREISFFREKTDAGLSFIGTKIKTIAHNGSSGLHETSDFVDCAMQIRKRSSRNSDEEQKTWMAWEFNSCGQQVFESFPAIVPIASEQTWAPDRTHGTKFTVDVLGRLKSRHRPAHADQDHYIKIANTYLEGGARIQERTFAISHVDAQTNDIDALALVERRFIRMEEKDLIIETKDETGLLSKFEYDLRGALIQCTDPAGQMERHTYNTFGDLIALDNVYQNAAHAPKTSAIVFTYNDRHQLTRQVDVVGETIEFQRDSSGRLLKKIGGDGRFVNFTYDIGGSNNVSSITLFRNATEKDFESLVQFKWDHQGRLQSRKLTLGSGESFTMTLSYDWQDRIVEKTLPDLSVMGYEYRGSQLVTSSLSGGGTSTWSLKAETSKLSAFERAEETKIQGTGTESISHSWKFDSQGFPVTHTLSSDNATLVQESYFYNDLDQMSRKHETINAVTTDYKYHGRRLGSSQQGDTVTSYEYDAAGNIVKNRDMTVSYAAGSIAGSKGNGEDVFKIVYDVAGRMIERVTTDSSLQFEYDSFGALHSMRSPQGTTSIDFISDYEGKTLQRKHSDGTGDLFISNEYSVRTNKDGSRTIRHRLFSSEDTNGSAHLLGTVSTTHESPVAMRPLSNTRTINFAFSDTKGNVTHVFDSAHKLQEQLNYDNFGAPNSSKTDLSTEESSETYEGKYLDRDAGLIDFGGRWYDPLVGRFTTPDNILDISYLTRTDGLNRYAFENNDPINHVDPTGHWGWSAILGVVIGVVLVVAAIALTVATAGVAAPLLAALAGAAVGALAGGGVAGITYSVKHQDEKNVRTFWAGYATTVAIQAGIGAATGFAGAWAGPASTIAGSALRIGIKAGIGGASSLLSKAGERGVENIFYGKHEALFEGWAKTILTGALAGGAAGAIGNKIGADKPAAAFKLIQSQKVLAPAFQNIWLSVAKDASKTFGTAVITAGGGKLAGWGAGELNLMGEAMDLVKEGIKDGSFGYHPMR